MLDFQSMSPNTIKSTNDLKKHPQVKILLVEDSALIREILYDTIKNLNDATFISTAATQHKAISLLDDMQFDILLLDIELGQGNGFEVIHHIQKANYPFKQPILMMLTNHAHPHYRRLAESLGVHYFFDKSMDFDSAIEALEREATRFSSAQH
jgi:DNA-binding NarL/FixJ family response regulator